MLPMKLPFSHAMILLGLILLPAAGRAQDFSADVVYLPGTAGPSFNSDHGPSKIYVSKDKLRLETGGAGSILLVDRSTQTASVLFPAKKEYEPLTGRLSEYFRVKDPENACPDWQDAAEEKIACEKAGHELVNGRETVKYRNRTGSDVVANAVWIDIGLKFVVKWQSINLTVELRNIEDEQPAAELFSVPSDYQTSKPKRAMNKGFSKHSP